MAYIKRELKDYLLVGYRVLPGGQEKFWRCPSQEAYEKLQALETYCRKTQTPIPDPALEFGEHRRVTAVVAQRPQERTGEGITLRAWIRGNDDQTEGLFFTYARKMSENRKKEYVRILDAEAERFSNVPMADVTAADARRLLDELLVCPACQARALLAGEAAVALDPGSLSVCKLPWDYALHKQAGMSDEDIPCSFDADNPTHFPAKQRKSIEHVFRTLKAAWNAALKAKDQDPRLMQDIRNNPFKGQTVPLFADRPDNNDAMVALSHTQLQRWESTMPEWCAPAIPLGSMCMLRLSELVALTRASLSKHDGSIMVTVKRTVVQAPNGSAGARGHGKTHLATKGRVMLTLEASRQLQQHLDQYCSDTNQDCPACKQGLRDHWDSASPNRHRKCGFASNTPLFRKPSNGARPSPSKFAEILEEAAVAASLTVEALGFKVTSKALRASGATHYLDAGVPDALVVDLGRWTNQDTMKRHYTRVNVTTRRAAAEAVERHKAIEMGEAPPDATLLEEATSLKRQIAALEDELAVCRLSMAAQGVEAAAPPTRVQACERPPTKFNDDAVRAAVRAGGSRKAMLEHIGVALAKKNYERLEQRCNELGLELPPLQTNARDRAA